ncbi:hypothetical protein ACIOD2_20435 [Amycolatopsis sp. NPDC088138]|uniref:hypothetical protein n=1 Tax=Amycolatopsis sp. NPDC088138 TaxID=3363938 RepID=UPI00381AFA45
MDIDAVRTFAAAADAGRFQDAAADRSVTQQAAVTARRSCRTLANCCWFDAETAVAAVRDGSNDASFRAVVALSGGVASMAVLDEPLLLLCGPAHVPATAPAVTPAQLAGHRIWMPGIVPGTEWAT